MKIYLLLGIAIAAVCLQAASAKHCKCDDKKVCPKRFFLPCDGCKVNEDCKDGQICCQAKGCGQQCATPIVKCQERCPIHKEEICPDLCDSNDDCSGGQICCQGECGKRCVDPITQGWKPKCPSKDSIPCDTCKENCDCKEGKICCKTKYCGQKCVDPVEECVELCPKRRDILCPYDECDDDHCCPEGLLCCPGKGKCGKKCVEPVFKKQKKH